ncbi:hypothetical protein [Kitasatospora sp. NPDC085464]|uniref:hypothetical protein n=1 Tax=Kitasatospora sp. NPDC085464 TaxID=3364063 RepID=UPI0037CB2534
MAGEGRGARPDQPGLGARGAEGLRPSGLHHEVYLGDPRRTALEKLKTVVRQPVERLG